jgi:hypothetical protein
LSVPLPSNKHSASFDDWVTVVPDWPAPAGVKALMTTRQGGASALPSGGFNLATHVGDDAQQVALNRQQLMRHMGAQPVFLEQVHGGRCIQVSAGMFAANVRADAAFTADAGVACTVMVADCLPVLFAHAHMPIVAAAHAGWRGLAGGGVSADGLDVLGNTLQSMAQQAHMPLADFAPGVLAWLGPCIGPEHFQVGADVLTAFMAGPMGSFAAGMQACFQHRADSPHHVWADLAALARCRLHQLGVGQLFGNDSSSPWCTVSQTQTWFSHRSAVALNGQTGGRMAACIWLSDPLALSDVEDAKRAPGHLQNPPQQSGA